MQFEAYGRTDTGPVREQNEDTHLVDSDRGVFIVADGMGGHRAGEVASKLAVDNTHRILVDATDPDETRLVRDTGVEDAADVLRERLRYAMNQASLHVRQQAEGKPDLQGMGTTLVVLVVDGDQAHLAHVGDSRAYLFRDDRLMRLTRDHTVVQQEVDAGRLTPELARMLPHKHILTQSVGSHGPVEPDTTTRMVLPDDVFMLCSDGLTDPLTDQEIEQIMRETPLDLMCHELVEKALGAGGDDNVTVLVVGVESTDA